MERILISLLRGVCQMPAYVAFERGFFRRRDLAVELEIAPTAWLVPDQLNRGAIDFAVIPWTRVAAAKSGDNDLVLVCGSGCEEAALVVRAGLSLPDVRSVAVPHEGGIKDLTAAALMRGLGWDESMRIRMPSGDAAILALVGHGADAASMVEPFATALEEQEVGWVASRTGDVWPGAPGCSLTTTRHLLDERPGVVERMVSAFVEGADFVERHPAEAAAIAEPYIGVGRRLIEKALARNRPSVHALSNEDSMEAILDLMIGLGYIDRQPAGYVDLSTLHAVAAPPSRV
jgi:ABC-type nitrate/sulfonate/bicarbonate transport system substrate-binding protein